MVDISSFLAEGAEIPQGSALQAMQSGTVLPPWYTNYAQQLLSNQQALMNSPYQVAPMPAVAEFSPTTEKAFEMTGQAAGSFRPGMDMAMQSTQNAMQQPGALAAAQPLINQAGQSSVANISDYMNPYTEQVVNRIGELGGRNLRENLMPGIEGRYIAAGQLGFGGRGGGQGTPSGMMTDTARALRDTQEAVLAQQNQALSEGYGQALGASSADLSRMGTLAGMTGNLADQSIRTDLGGALQFANLGGMEQNLGLQGAGALGAVGSAIENKAQANLDAARADFEAQRNDPQNKINAALNTFSKTATGVPTGKTEYGLVPSGQPSQYEPGTAATIGGALTGLAGLLSSIGGL